MGLISSEAIIAATEIVANETGLSGNKGQSISGTGISSSGYGMGRLKVIQWYE